MPMRMLGFQAIMVFLSLLIQRSGMWTGPISEFNVYVNVSLFGLLLAWHTGFLRWLAGGKTIRGLVSEFALSTAGAGVAETLKAAFPDITPADPQPEIPPSRPARGKTRIKMR